MSLFPYYYFYVPFDLNILKFPNTAPLCVLTATYDLIIYSYKLSFFFFYSKALLTLILGSLYQSTWDSG